jgi:RNA polymerase sigma factor (sigma-70 family)
VFASWGRVRRADNPVAYTRTVLTRTWLSHRRLRRTTEQPVELVPEAPGHETDPVGRLDLLEALSRLRPEERAVVVLRFYLDLSVAQTAQLLGLSEVATRKRCSRALERLRSLIPDLEMEDYS